MVMQAGTQQSFKWQFFRQNVGITQTPPKGGGGGSLKGPWHEKIKLLKKLLLKKNWVYNDLSVWRFVYNNERAAHTIRDSKHYYYFSIKTSSWNPIQRLLITDFVLNFRKFRNILVTFDKRLQQHITECFCRANSLLPRTKTNLWVIITIRGKFYFGGRQTLSLIHHISPQKEPSHFRATSLLESI